MPTSEFILYFVPYFVLNMWMFGEVSRGYGNIFYTEQYNMARFSVFCSASMGWLAKNRKFVVTNKNLAKLAKTNKSRGIFSSPPYVGLIDYHEQHAYAYDLFGFERQDNLEIGAMHKKQSKQAQQDYANGIANVLNNCRRFLAEDFDVFLVANDKYNLYQQIAENAKMQIVNQYKRPVLNRTEKDKGAYSEIIFHLKRR